MPSRVYIDYNSIKTKILFTSRKKVSFIFNKVHNELTTLIREIIRTELYNSPETDSLLTEAFGSLKSQFGLTDDMAINAIDDIVVLATSTVSLILNASPVEPNLIASMTLNLTGLDIQKFLSLPSVSYVSERSGSKIEWLDWLLTKGSQIVVFDWRMKPGNGRSSAIMVQRGSFRVEGFQGISEDNWITRAIDRAKLPIYTLIKTKLSHEF